jgi:hypothetical protein
VFALVLGIAGCAADPYAGFEPVPAAELVRMTSGNTLLIDSTAQWPFQTLLFIAPGGGGWWDGRLEPGSEPQTTGMAMALAWRITDDDDLCVWTSPLISEMPTFTPPDRACLRVIRMTMTPDVMVATSANRQRTITAPARLVSGNSFPPARIAQYERQVRVLFGGQMPTWRVP